jgi:hypothetical protein
MWYLGLLAFSQFSSNVILQDCWPFPSFQAMWHFRIAGLFPVFKQCDTSGLPAFSQFSCNVTLQDCWPFPSFQAVWHFRIAGLFPVFKQCDTSGLLAFSRCQLYWRWEMFLKIRIYSVSRQFLLFASCCVSVWFLLAIKHNNLCYYINQFCVQW